MLKLPASSSHLVRDLCPNDQVALCIVVDIDDLPGRLIDPVVERNQARSTGVVYR